MRIAVFTKSTTYHKGHGGLETQNKLLCEGLAKKGHSVVVFSPQRDQNLANTREVQVEYVFIPCSYRYFLSSFNSNSWYNRSYEFLLNYSKDVAFDLILGQSSAATGLIARKQELNIPIVSISHGTTLGELKTQITNAKSLIDFIRVIKDGQYVLRQFFGRQRDFVLKSDHVIAVSSAVKANLVEETFVSEENVSVINNGIDPTSFSKVKTGRDLTGKGILFVGQLTKDKGIDLLFNYFRDKAFSGLTLYIAGDGPLKDDLATQIKESNLSARVFLLGKIHYSEVVNLYTNSDIILFAFPTRREEGLPMVLVEAMFAGLPVIAFDKGGVTDVVFNEETGYVLPPKDIAGFGDKLLQLSKDPDTLKKFSNSALEKAYSRFSIDVMIEKYEEVFKKVIN